MYATEKPFEHQETPPDADAVRGLGSLAAHAQPLVGELPARWDGHYDQVDALHVSAEQAHETGYAD